MKTIKSYGVQSQTREITARRSFFLVDQQGIVRQKWLPEEGAVFPSETLLEAVRAISIKK